MFQSHINFSVKEDPILTSVGRSHYKNEHDSLAIVGLPPLVVLLCWEHYCFY